MIKLNRNFIITTMLLLIVGGASWRLKKGQDTSLNTSKVEKPTEIKKEGPKDSGPTITTVSPPLPSPEISSGELNTQLSEFFKNLNTTSPKNISNEDILVEIKEIQSFLDDEEVTKKLNANEVSKEDRESLNNIFLRLQALKEVRIARTLSNLEKDVNGYQKIHAQRVKKFVHNEEEEDIN
ncbi:MAG: hypothetical protein ACHQYQ_07660 [Bacteriovoracales bacterium]